MVNNNLVGGDWNHGILWLSIIYGNNHPNWLVVWNIIFLTFHSVGNVIIPTDELTNIFQRGRSTTNQLLFGLVDVSQCVLISWEIDGNSNVLAIFVPSTWTFLVAVDTFEYVWIVTWPPSIGWYVPQTNRSISSHCSFQLFAAKMFDIFWAQKLPCWWNASRGFTDADWVSPT